MSFIAVQRVMVRMLYDPAFTAAVFAHPEDALRDVALSTEEVGWLTSTDPRAWQLDPMRRSRTLQALLEEYPVSSATVLSVDGHAHRLDAFFSSPSFHEAIQARRALVWAFGEFLSAQGVATLEGMARIEEAIARCRRQDSAAPCPPRHITLSRGHVVLNLPTGTLAQFTAVLGQLNATGQAPVEAMLAEGFQLGSLPTQDGASREYALVEPSASGPAVGEIPDELGQLLQAAEHPVARVELLRLARALGAEEADELLDELIVDGLLEAGPQG